MGDETVYENNIEEFETEDFDEIDLMGDEDSEDIDNEDYDDIDDDDSADDEDDLDDSQEESEDDETGEVKPAPAKDKGDDVQALKAQIEELNKAVKGYREALSDYGFDGEDKDRIDAMRARKKGITVEEYRKKESEIDNEVTKRLESHPEVVAAREKLREEIFARDLAEIKQYDSDCTADNIKDIPNFERFQKLMSTKHLTGITTVEAYKLANDNKIQQIKTAKARQAAINNIKSKDHLKTKGGEVGNYSAVPKDVKEWMAKLNPKATEKQIREYYNKNIKKERSGN